jgi:hypothetical protein
MGEGGGGTNLRVYPTMIKVDIHVVNATFLCFETSKLWVLICIFVDRWKVEGLR